MPTTESSLSIDSSDDLNLMSDDHKPSQHMSRQLSNVRVAQKKTPTPALVNKISLLTNFLASVDNVGSSVGSFVQTQTHVSSALRSATHGFQVAGIGFAVIDFVRIPGIYLRALLQGEKPPITLSKNARWLYASVLLGLTIASLAVPFVAPFLALAAASVTLGVSLSTMGQTLYHRYTTPRKLKTIKDTIDNETQELERLQLKTLELEEKLISIDTQDKHSKQKIALEDNIKGHTRAFNSLFEARQEHYETQFKYETILNKHNTATVMDKGIATALSAIALAGLALSLFFPPLGAGLLAGCALIGLGYFIARVALPPFKHWITGLFRKSSTSSEIIETSVEQQKLSQVNANELSATLEKSSIGPAPSIADALDKPGLLDQEMTNEILPPPYQESTTVAMELLFGNQGAAIALHKQIAENQSLEDVQNTLSTLVNNHDVGGILTFFNQVSSSIQTANANITTEDMRQFFCNFDDLKPALLLLKQAISEVKTGVINLSKQDKSQLLFRPALREFLHEQGIELPELVREKGQLQPDPTPTFISEIARGESQNH